MNKIAFILILLLCHLIAASQKPSPSYVEIIKTFCANYETSEDYYNYTSFAKKKDGWYVTQSNKIQSDKILDEKLFYSYQQNKYLDLSDFYRKPSETDIDKQLEKYLNYGGGTSEWYGFERITYYGYNGWYEDMIKDFGDRQDLSDTMHDGLGRSYINLARSYLWYQSGGMYQGQDTLRRKLERLEYPTKQRIEKIRSAIDVAIAHFTQVKTLNPSYKTIVGNASLKVFNEYMHGYDQMKMCSNELLAKEYLEKASLDQKYILQAKNYLNSCEQNAILFSYGDNDTYQLWYVQEKFNFRKDIIVINNSLLGLPIYIDMLKRKQTLIFSVTDSFLNNPSNDIVYFDENKKVADTTDVISLMKFLDIIYSNKYSSTTNEGLSYATYPYCHASLLIPDADFTPANLGKQIEIRFSLNKQYYFNNDLAMFDIIANNINKHPIYFTSLYGNPFEQNLMQKGIVYKLVSDDINLPLQRTIETKGLEKFINEIYTPVLSNDSIISFDGDNAFFGLYYTILNYYLQKSDTANLKPWLSKLNAACPKIYSTQINIARNLAYYLLEAGESNKALIIVSQYAQWLNDAYTHPNSLSGFYSKEKYLEELTKTRNYLISKNLFSPKIDHLLEE